jgi:hypothetical protein
MMFIAITGNQSGITLVGFGARHFGDGKSFDDRRVEDTDAMSSLMKVSRQPFAIGSGSFHTGVNRQCFVFGKPDTGAMKSGSQFLSRA